MKPANQPEVFSELDWNFDAVPDRELAVCCLWEYARESAFICLVREQSKHRIAESLCMNLGPKEHIDFVEVDFRKAWNTLGRKAILFQEGIYSFEGDEFFVSPFPRSWLSLSKFERSILIKTAEWDVSDVAGRSGFRRAYHAYALALAKLFHPKSLKEVFGGDGRISRQDFYRSGHKLRSICPNLMSRDGSEILIVEIDWGEFTNEELVEQFAQWLKENDPPGVSRPDKRGHKHISYRVKLERLGIMRLLHRFTRVELKTANPPAWKHYNSKNRRWRNDVEKSLSHFRELFPFVPQDEFPGSWPTKTPLQPAK
jgi:hypothetical protein